MSTFCKGSDYHSTMFSKDREIDERKLNHPLVWYWYKGIYFVMENKCWPRKQIVTNI